MMWRKNRKVGWKKKSQIDYSTLKDHSITTYHSLFYISQVSHSLGQRKLVQVPLYFSLPFLQFHFQQRLLDLKL